MSKRERWREIKKVRERREREKETEVEIDKEGKRV